MSETISLRESERLAALKRYHILNTPPEKIFDDLVALAASICETPMAIVSFVDETRQWFKASIGFSQKETPREIAFCACTISSDKPLIVPDATQDTRFAQNPLVLSEPSIRFYAGIPMMTSDGSAIGSLCILDRKAHQLSEKHLECLKILARQTMAHLDQRLTSQLLADALERVDQLKGLLPICPNCRSLRDDEDYKERVETYFRSQPNEGVIQSFCPKCVETEFPVDGISF